MRFKRDEIIEEFELRIKKKFLFLPLTLFVEGGGDQRETRWLETAYVHQLYLWGWDDMRWATGPDDPWAKEKKEKRR